MEVAHGQVMAPKNPHMGDILSIFIQSLRSGDHIVQVLPAQLTAIGGKADRRHRKNKFVLQQSWETWE